MNWNKIDSSWKEFCKTRNIDLKYQEQQLFSQILKQKEYSTIEKVDKYPLCYFSHFYIGDNIDLTNSFKIVVPVESNLNLKIQLNPWFKRFFKINAFRIECDNLICSEIKELQKKLYKSFRRFPDLEIRLGLFGASSNNLIDKNDVVLQISTKKHLPEHVDSIELFRETVIKTFNIFQDKIKPARILN